MTHKSPHMQTPPGQPSRTEVIEDLRKRLERQKRPRTAVALSALGVLILVVTLVLNAMQRPISLWLFTGIGFMLMIFGYYVRDPNKAIAFAGVVVNSVGGILAIILRVGQRKDDPVVVVPVIPETPSQDFPAVKPTERGDGKIDYTKGRNVSQGEKGE